MHSAGMYYGATRNTRDMR